MEQKHGNSPFTWGDLSPRVDISQEDIFDPKYRRVKLDEINSPFYVTDYRIEDRQVVDNTTLKPRTIKFIHILLQPINSTERVVLSTAAAGVLRPFVEHPHDVKILMTNNIPARLEKRQGKTYQYWALV